MSLYDAVKLAAKQPTVTLGQQLAPPSTSTTSRAPAIPFFLRRLLFLAMLSIYNSLTYICKTNQFVEIKGKEMLCMTN